MVKGDVGHGFEKLALPLDWFEACIISCMGESYPPHKDLLDNFVSGPW